jgi:hypothetical protein
MLSLDRHTAHVGIAGTGTKAQRLTGLFLCWLMGCRHVERYLSEGKRSLVRMKMAFWEARLQLDASNVATLVKFGGGNLLPVVLWVCGTLVSQCYPDSSNLVYFPGLFGRVAEPSHMC